MLPAKRNANDGDAKNEAEHKMENGRFPTAKNKPKDIHNQAGSSKTPRLDGFSKWPQNKTGNLETLKPKRNANNRNAAKAPQKKPNNRSD